MESSVASGVSLEKRDYGILGLIVAFSVYAYFVMDDILAALMDTSGNSGLSGSFVTLITVVPLLVFAIVLSGLGKGVWAETRLSLRVVTGRKAVLPYVALIATAFAWYPESTNTTPMSYSLLYLPLILNIIAGELVLRAMLTDLICKVTSNSWVNIPLSFVLSGLLFFLVFLQLQTGPMWSVWGLALFFGLGALIYILESSLFFHVWICVDVFRIVRHAGVQEDVYFLNFIATLVILFVLITAARFISRPHALTGNLV